MEDTEFAPAERRIGFGQFCPISVASEVLAEKWTILVLRELLAGSDRFNDIQRGVPLMSPSLLTQRLRNLEHWGLLNRVQEAGQRGHRYQLTDAGRSLGPIIDSIGVWGLQHMRQTVFSDRNLDPSLLLWDMRRWIRPEHFPGQRAVIMISILDVQKRVREYWLVKDSNEAVLDLCLEDPGFDVDLLVSADIETMVRVWMGDLSLDSALRTGKIEFNGSSALRMSVHDWIGLSPFAQPVRTPVKPAAGGMRA